MWNPKNNTNELIYKNGNTTRNSQEGVSLLAGWM